MKVRLAMTRTQKNALSGIDFSNFGFLGLYLYKEKA